MKFSRTILAGVAAVGLLLTGCTSTATTDVTTAAKTETLVDGAASTLAVEHGMGEMTTVDMIDHLDRLAVDERPTDLFASVRPDSLVLSDGQTEETLELPSNLSYVSIAPFVTQTHDCYYHSLTTCLGELSNAEVDVKITDDATGEVLVSQTATTFDNGFVGYWLPRDFDGTIEITQGNLVGSTPVTTDSDGATCVTTLQLS